MKKVIIIILVCFNVFAKLNAQQIMSLSVVLDSIKSVNPALKMYDYEIRSMEEAAKGARSWMPLELGTGFWMTPYDVSRWKKMDDGMGGFEEGMGQYMISAQQMFPNRKKQDAEFAYMSAMSSVEKEKKKLFA